MQQSTVLQVTLSAVSMPHVPERTNPLDGLHSTLVHWRRTDSEPQQKVGGPEFVPGVELALSDS